jgi:hypothetical protein
MPLFEQQKKGMKMVRKETGKGAKASTSTSAPKKRISAKKTSGLVSKKEGDGSARTNHDAIASAVPKWETIALLAYTYWMQRGCQGGSAEEDWFRAEREIDAASPGPLAGN